MEARFVESGLLFCTLMETVQDFAGLEESLLKYAFLHVPATVECDEATLALD